MRLQLIDMTGASVTNKGKCYKYTCRERWLNMTFTQVFITSQAKSRQLKVRQNCTYSLNRMRSSGYVVVPFLYLGANSIILPQVEQAVREIKRLLIEASAAALQAEMRNPTASGRYSVV
jgi:ATP-dependent RNA helicase DDX46/PRP5